MAGIAHKLLLQVFLDMRKSYDLLDRGVCLEILKEYGMETNLDQLLGHYYEKHRGVPMV